MKKFRVETINIKNLRNGLKASRHQLGYKLKHKQEDGVPKEEIARFLQANRIKHNLAEFNIERLEKLINEYERTQNPEIYNKIKKILSIIKMAISRQ